MKFRKKPVVIDAFQWDGTLMADQWPSWADGIKPAVSGATLVIPTLEGTMHATPDDWIIKGVKGELYPCKPEIFSATYEAVE